MPVDGDPWKALMQLALRAGRDDLAEWIAEARNSDPVAMSLRELVNEVKGMRLDAQSQALAMQAKMDALYTEMHALRTAISDEPHTGEAARPPSDQPPRMTDKATPDTPTIRQRVAMDVFWTRVFDFATQHVNYKQVGAFILALAVIVVGGATVSSRIADYALSTKFAQMWLAGPDTLPAPPVESSSRGGASVPGPVPGSAIGLDGPAPEE